MSAIKEFLQNSVGTMNALPDGFQMIGWDTPGLIPFTTEHHDARTTVSNFTKDFNISFSIDGGTAKVMFPGDLITLVGDHVISKWTLTPLHPDKDKSAEENNADAIDQQNKGLTAKKLFGDLAQYAEYAIYILIAIIIIIIAYYAIKHYGVPRIA